MKGKRKKIQHFFIYLGLMVISGFLIVGGLKQLTMTQQLKASISKKQEEKKSFGF